MNDSLDQKLLLAPGRFSIDRHRRMLRWMI